MEKEGKSEKENIFFAEEKKNREGYGGKYLEKDNTFLRRRKKRGKEKEENIWRREIFIWGGEENGLGNGGKYLERENICGGEEK